MSESKTIKELKEQIKRLQQDVKHLATNLRVPQDETDRVYFWLGRALQKIRTERSVNQEALARDLGLTRTSLANMEAGKQKAPLHVWKNAALRLKVDLPYLLELSAALEEDHTEMMNEGA